MQFSLANPLCTCLSNFNKVVYFVQIFRFGSIISGAIQSKLSAKKDTSGGIGSSTQKKQKHGSFSFLGGMQVSLYIYIYFNQSISFYPCRMRLGLGVLFHLSW